jgi:hypothetical protein
MKMRLSFILVILAVLHCPIVMAKDSPKSNGKQPDKAANTQPIPQSNAQLDRGLNVDFWYGGWEPDYTKTAYEAMFSYRAIDQFHLVAGFGDSKQVYYDRSKVYAGAYYFYEDYSYFRMFVSERKYKYPIAPGAVAPNPDSSSYERVPKLELEVSQYFNQDLRGALSYELSRPNFFHDKDTSITVQKFGGELAFATPNPKVRAKVFATLLRDPDPNKTEIKGFDNPWTAQGVASATSVVNRTTSLLGGAVQYVEDKWNVEVKYMQNRDLDNSYDYSLLGKFTYRLDDARSVQIDHVHDRFSNQSNLRGKTADVYLASYFQQISPDTKCGFGLKHIGVPNFNQNTGFIYIQYKTGVIW